MVLTGWHRRSTDTAALSSAISRISTAYTDDPNWGSFTAARSSFREEYYSTQTFFVNGPEFTPSLVSVVRTADDPTAAASSIFSQSLVAADEFVSLYVDFVSTQTYLEEDARSGLHSDLQAFTSLWEGTTTAPSGSTSASASGSSRTATPRTQTSVSTAVVVMTRPTSTSTGTTAATTGGVAGAPAANGVVAGALAGFFAVVRLLL